MARQGASEASRWRPYGEGGPRGGRRHQQGQAEQQKTIKPGGPYHALSGEPGEPPDACRTEGRTRAP